MSAAAEGAVPGPKALAGRVRVPPGWKGAAPKERAAELTKAAEEAGAGPVLAAIFRDHPGLAAFLATLADLSPFLRGLMLDDPARLARLLAAEPGEHAGALCREVAAAWRDHDEAGLAVRLRRARAEIALLVALADLGGAWDLEEVTAALTAFADAAVAAAASRILLTEHEAGRISLADPGRPAENSGWIILGLGKFGAAELNYSSDIDLIVLFERERVGARDPGEVQKLLVRMTQRLVRLLQERTAEGYVFRTDLRLRPDPGSTAVALSTAAALQYYEALGQNWERAALIKARPVAGDIAAGEAFLSELAPYIWRKYLDYSAIADIHSIKRQIHDHRGHGAVAVAGHNIKLGRGGIREIEFFVQTQQLIAGGRNPALRGRRTVDMLAGLAAAGWIDPVAARELVQCYRKLREIEHRLQMVADEQTHTLPEEDEGLERLARLAGYRSAASFETALRRILEQVRDHYVRLFEAAPALSTSGGSLVFTGDDDDPDTMQTLSRLGFADPAGVGRTVRAWHYGRYPAMRSSAARERLTELVPALLEALAGTDNADAALGTFDRFLARLPAGVQLFSLLSSNRRLLGLLVTILGTAPRLADTIIRRPHVLDALLEPAFFDRLPDRRTLARNLSATLALATGYEDALDRARIFGQEQSFLIGVRIIAGPVEARQANAAYADLAEVILAALLDLVRAEFERAHGRMPKGRVALVAMGKLGGREMTAASDLDLILLYDFNHRAAGSDGPRPLAGGQYYARLTQRLVAALAAPTAEGRLYEVDFRLRPSGKSGPLATRIDAFARYQAEEAWTWEHMALTRARAIAGDRSLVARAAREIAKVLTRERDPRKLRADVLDMRALVEAEKGGGGPWDLKQAAGGLVDIEFIAQYLQLRHAHARPAILSGETATALRLAGEAGLLPAAETEILLPALRLYQAISQVIRLCLDAPLRPEEAPRGLLDLLARAGELPDFATLDAHVRETGKAVRAAFERLVGTIPPSPAG